ncbi:MAG: lytic transglycosylase domain-containing protein [Myxococcota bacterium]
MPRVAWILIALVGCAAESPPPAQPPAAPVPTEASDAPAPVVDAEPEPAAAAAPAPEVEPAATAEAAVDPPKFEPLKLNDEQLARAKKVQPLVAQAAEDFDLDPNLINGIIWTESKFNPKARNRSGAKGLMQLMPITARGMSKKLGRPVRVYDPEFSIQAGSKLLSIMLERFDGDEELALFAFARGGGRVRGWQANGETQMPEGVVKFIARVRRGQQTFEGLGFPGV